jgi:hypothetical protein
MEYLASSSGVGYFESSRFNLSAFGAKEIPFAIRTDVLENSWTNI